MTEENKMGLDEWMCKHEDIFWVSGVLLVISTFALIMFADMQLEKNLLKAILFLAGCGTGVSFALIHIRLVVKSVIYEA
jgi:hypothetical protein